MYVCVERERDGQREMYINVIHMYIHNKCNKYFNQSLFCVISLCIINVLRPVVI